jgi:hypothetical protein
MGGVTTALVVGWNNPEKRPLKTARNAYLEGYAAT